MSKMGETESNSDKKKGKYEIKKERKKERRC